MEEVVFSIQTNNNTLYHRCTQLGNFPRPNYVVKYSNRDLLAKVTKNLAINIQYMLVYTCTIFFLFVELNKLYRYIFVVIKG